LIHSYLVSDFGDDERPQIATDGTGDWIGVWDSFGAFGGSGTQLDILISRSSDNGATWTSPGRLNTNGNIQSRQDWRPALATDSKGSWVAVWYTNERPGTTTLGRYAIVVTRSTNNGASWTPEAVLNSTLGSPSGDEQIPRIATDGRGHWVCAWESSNAVLGKGTDFDILVSRSDDRGVSWTAPALLNSYGTTDSGVDSRVEISTDEAGLWVAAWSTNSNVGAASGSDYEIAFARSTDNGATWSAARLLNSDGATDVRQDFRPALATDGQGDWISAWHGSGGNGSDNDIYVAQSRDNAQTWSGPVLLNPTGTNDSGEDSDVRLLTDHARNWIAVWDSNSSVSSGTGPDYEVLYSISTDKGLTWSVPAALNSDSATESGYDLVPQLGTDDLGNWLAIWESTETASSDFDISYSRFSLHAPGVWVDFGYPGAERGTYAKPFQTLDAAVLTASPLDTVFIKGKTATPYTLEKPTIRKTLRIEAIGGPVRIGGKLN
jgi:hypothetical protein